MIIGIDAISFSHPQPGGYKTYVTNLLAALQRTPSQHTLRVFLDREVSPAAKSVLPNGKGIVVSNRIPVLRQVLREQIQMPRQAAKERCSIIHYTANTAPAYSRTPFVLTLHDVIALTEPQAPLALSRKRLWQWMIDKYARYVIPVAVNNCQAVITVSKFEKDEIARHLGLPPVKIHAIHLAPSLVFRPLSRTEREAAESHIRSTYKVGPRYILAIGHEPRKNVSNVVQAYGRLDGSIRKLTQLLIVCARPHAKEALQREIADLHLEGTVRIIDGVHPEELNRLYNKAVALVFPSLRESFGLPPLESMACGTPVIASNTSSLPEVLGDAAILVTPTDIPALTSAMERVLTDRVLSDELSERGLVRSQQFSWDKTARETLAVYEQVAGLVGGRSR